MITANIENVRRVTKNLLKYSSRIKERVWNDILFVGNEVRDRINREFPQTVLTISMNPNQLSYSIMVDNLVICDVSGLVILTGAEKSSAYKGLGYFESSADFTEYRRTLIDYYFNIAKERIRNTIHTILK